MNKPTLVVLAAGMGSRYGGLKQMDPMGPNGETVLDYSVFDAIRAGFDRVIFIIREDFSDLFKQQIGDKFRKQIKVEYAYQKLDDLPSGFSAPTDRVKPWGTTHAVLAARQRIQESPFAVINADDFYGQDAFKQMAKHFASKPSTSEEIAQCSMVGYSLENTLSEHGNVNRGICSLKDKLLITVEEHLEISAEDDGVCRGENLQGERIPLPKSSIVSMNFWGFPPSLISDLQAHFDRFLEERGNELKSECYIPTVIDEMIQSGRAECTVLETSSSWFGVTYPDDKDSCVSSLKTLVENGEYPQQLW
ncbi:nucleotidyltransferase family protein [Rubritalea marina]|uniref:nucleotidyltransferase family protein n=1 Tax=Rubritalea marina TaxID=361055 RepID=UPI0003A2B169|nr:sugar phosphate nucleotidyltransferase [Rubritalea marina]